MRKASQGAVVFPLLLLLGVSAIAQSSVRGWGGKVFNSSLGERTDQVEVAVGGGHTVARRSDGSVVAWGHNPNGQCDVPEAPAGLGYSEIAGSMVLSIARLGPRSTVVRLGVGCAGSMPSAPLVPLDTPRIGSVMQIRLFELPLHLAVMNFGLSTSQSRIGPLPFDLSPLGMPGCSLRVSIDADDRALALRDGWRGLRHPLGSDTTLESQGPRSIATALLRDCGHDGIGVLRRSISRGDYGSVEEPDKGGSNGQFSPLGVVEAAAVVSHAALPTHAPRVRNLLDGLDARVCIALDNLASVQIPGFKRRCLRAVAGEVLLTEAVDWSPGVLEATHRRFDLAIDGIGFFQVQRLDGSTAYTRSGQFRLNAGGKLVTGSGRVLQPEITLPTDLLDLHVASDGRVMGRTAGSPDASSTFGQFQLGRFPNLDGLVPAGSNCWGTTDESGSPTLATPGSCGLGTLRQGFIERSNVVVADELVELRHARRQHASVLETLTATGLVPAITPGL